MTSVVPKKSRLKQNAGEPAWSIALFFPMQGEWTEEAYFALESRSGNWMIELANGFLEFPPLPDMFHQDIVDFLFSALKAFLKEHPFGRPYFAPLPVRLWPGQIREPDIAVFAFRRITNKRKAPDGADLVIEVVSPGEEARERDLDVKRVEYAKAKIPEYWIVDSELKTITVLVLSDQNVQGSRRVHTPARWRPRSCSRALAFPWRSLRGGGRKRLNLLSRE